MCVSGLSFSGEVGCGGSSFLMWVRVCDCAEKVGLMCGFGLTFSDKWKRCNSCLQVGGGGGFRSG